jgi:hypothetical protein
LALDEPDVTSGFVVAEELCIGGEGLGGRVMNLHVGAANSHRRWWPFLQHGVLYYLYLI